MLLVDLCQKTFCLNVLVKLFLLVSEHLRTFDLSNQLFAFKF